MKKKEIVAKRLMDLGVSFSAMIFLTPLLAAISLIIYLIDGRPIIFSEFRAGRRGRPFTIYKFRTLKKTGFCSSVATGDDPRLTKTGRFLRRQHLDELPQLLNIIKGDMSLVGPRPMRLEHVDVLDDGVRGMLLSLRPGLTGPDALEFLAEDDALKGYAQAESLYIKYVIPAKSAGIIDYINNYSIMDDLEIILKTAMVPFSRDAYAVSCQKIRSLLPFN